MFGHLYLYRLKTLLRRKELIFWAMLFPIILGTLFKAGFGSTTDIAENYNTIPVAVVMEKESDESSAFLTTLESVEFSIDTPMFQTFAVSKVEAESLLKEETVDGIILLGDTVSLEFSKSEINQSIIKQFTDRYQQTVAIYMNLIETNPAAIETVMQIMHEDTSYLQEVSLGGEKVDSMLQYFYALIGMACLYGSFLGIANTEDMQANISALGARRHVTPTNHLKLIVADMLAAFTIHFTNIMIVCIYLRFILRVDIGTQPVPFLLVCLFGSIIGVSMGQFVGSITRKSAGMRVALSLGASMILSMLSGLMFSQMKYVVEQNAPIINRLNPAALITDAFFCLTVYDDYKRFTINIVSLGVIALIFTIGSFLAVRREKYASL